MKPHKPTILLLIILFAVLQCTLLNSIQIFQTKPDILLILVVFFALYYGQIYGLVVGAACGVFSAATCGLPSAIVVGAYSLGGLALGHIGRWVYDQKVFGQMGTCFIFCCIIYFTEVFLLQIIDIKLSLFKALVFCILPASFYTACLAPFLFRFLKVIPKIR